MPRKKNVDRCGNGHVYIHVGVTLVTRKDGRTFQQCKQCARDWKKRYAIKHGLRCERLDKIVAGTIKPFASDATDPAVILFREEARRRGIVLKACA